MHLVVLPLESKVLLLSLLRLFCCAPLWELLHGAWPTFSVSPDASAALKHISNEVCVCVCVLADGEEFD